MTIDAHTTAALIDMGCSVWSKAGVLPRYYYNPSPKDIGLRIETYREGGIYKAYQDGEKISNTSARNLLAALKQQKVYFDTTDGEWHYNGCFSTRLEQVVEAKFQSAMKVESSKETPVATIDIHAAVDGVWIQVDLVGTYTRTLKDTDVAACSKDALDHGGTISDVAPGIKKIVLEGVDYWLVKSDGSTDYAKTQLKQFLATQPQITPSVSSPTPTQVQQPAPTPTPSVIEDVPATQQTPEQVSTPTETAPVDAPAAPKDKKWIMSRAWGIAKAAAAKHGGKSKQYISEALKQAWAESRDVPLYDLLRISADGTEVRIKKGLTYRACQNWEKVIGEIAGCSYQIRPTGRQ